MADSLPARTHGVFSGSSLPLLDSRNSTPLILILASFASLILSAWGAWVEWIPNPDSAIYLRAAELMADGHWSEAVSFPFHRLPVYSGCIAAIMKLTGAGAWLSAQIVDAAFELITVLAFVGTVSRLANRDHLVVACAALVILLQPALTQFRPALIRDHGYLAFYATALYFVARSLVEPGVVYRFAAGAAVVLATLFRIEGAFLAPLIGIFYLVQNKDLRARPFSAHTVVLLVLLLAVLCASVVAGMWYYAGSQMTALLNGVFGQVGARLHQLKFDILPWGGGNSWGAYIGMVLGIALVNIARAASIPNLVLIGLAFFPRRVMPRSASAFVLWFALGQLPILLGFTFWMLFLDPRYAAGMVLVLNIALAFLLAAIWRLRWRFARHLFVGVTALLLVVWASKLPRPTEFGYLKDAGSWIGQHLPREARIFTNEPRIAYFSGRPYGDALRFLIEVRKEDLVQSDYLVLHVEGDDNLPAVVKAYPSKRLVHTIQGTRDWRVLVFELR